MKEVKVKWLINTEGYGMVLLPIVYYNGNSYDCGSVVLHPNDKLQNEKAIDIIIAELTMECFKNVKVKGNETLMVTYKQFYSALIDRFEELNIKN